MIQEKFDVLLVGTGAASSSTAIRLLQFASRPLSIVAVERFPQRGNGGLAYGGPGTDWHDVFNIQAGRMSIFREDVDDFMLWANTESERGHWPDQWRNFTFTVSGPAPRRIYADYIAYRLRQALAEAPPGSVYREHVGEVYDISPSVHNGYCCTSIHVQDGTGETINRILHGRQIIIGTGNEFRQLPFTEYCNNHPSFIRVQYSSDGYARMTQVGENDTVVIVGSALSGHDAALTLSRDLGHRGPVTMISRHGASIRTYPENHQHAVIAVRRPPLLDREYAGKKQLVRDIKAEWRYISDCLQAEYPKMSPDIYSERVLKAWEPYIVELIRKMPDEDVEHLLNEYNSLLSSQRVTAMRYATLEIEKCDLSIIAAHIQTIRPNEAGTLTVAFNNEEGQHTIDADLVIANLNRETDYEKVKNPLWRSLIDRHGLATAHKSTKRGVEVGPYGELVSADGQMSNYITTVGLPREGAEIANHGRLGPFAFNIATLKNHSIATAMRTIAVLEGISKAGQQTLTDNLESLLQRFVPDESKEAFAQAFDDLVSLHVHWMAARKRTDKEAIVKKLNILKKDICDRMNSSDCSNDEKNSYLKSACVREAIRRMTDVSVTPLDLRSRLGLAENQLHDSTIAKNLLQ